MASEIIIQYSKTLKLSNAMILELSKEEDFEQLENLEKLIEQMELHIKSKGAQPIGPLIQKTSVFVDNNGCPQMMIAFIRQASKFINHVDPPYKMESLIRINNCLYTRFIGQEEDLQFAYNKIKVTGYEKQIPLKEDTYTVFIDEDETDQTLVADVFIPCCG